MSKLKAFGMQQPATAFDLKFRWHRQDKGTAQPFNHFSIHIVRCACIATTSDHSSSATKNYSFFISQRAIDSFPSNPANDQWPHVPLVRDAHINGFDCLPHSLCVFFLRRIGIHRSNRNIMQPVKRRKLIHKLLSSSFGVSHQLCVNYSY